MGLFLGFSPSLSLEPFLSGQEGRVRVRTLAWGTPCVVREISTEKATLFCLSFLRVKLLLASSGCLCLSTNRSWRETWTELVTETSREIRTETCQELVTESWREVCPEIRTET